MKPGTIVVVNFVGATGTKRRPAVVVSTAAYASVRPDVIVALITSKVTKASDASDASINDWAEAGLDRPSAVRTFLQTYPKSLCRIIGQLSDTDWLNLQKCLRFSIEV